MNVKLCEVLQGTLPSSSYHLGQRKQNTASHPHRMSCPIHCFLCARKMKHHPCQIKHHPCQIKQHPCKIKQHPSFHSSHCPVFSLRQHPNTHPQMRAQSCPFFNLISLNLFKSTYSPSISFFSPLQFIVEELTEFPTV